MPGGLQGFPGDVNIQGNLFVQGNIQSSGTFTDFPLLATDGSAAAPSYSFAGATNTGVSRTVAGLTLSHAGIQIATFASGPTVNIGQTNVPGASNFVFGGGNTNNTPAGQSFGNTLMIGRNINTTKADDSMIIGALANNVTNLQDGCVVGSTNTWSAGVDAGGRPNVNGYVFGLSNSITLTNGLNGAIVTCIGQGNTYSSAGAPSLSLFGNGLTNARGLPDFLSKGATVVGSGDGILLTTTYTSWDSDVGIITDVPKGNIVEQRNGLNAQTFRIYNTFTDVNNYENGGLSWGLLGVNTLSLFTNQTGTGLARSLNLGTLGAAAINIITNNVSRWAFTSTGPLQPAADNTYDIGSLATRIRNLNVGSFVQWGNPTDVGITRNAAGVVEINNGVAGTFRDLIARSFSAQTVGNAPTATVSQTYMWGVTNQPIVSFVDSSRTANNRLVDFNWTGGVFAGRFANDLYGAVTPWINVAGGQAVGVTSILFGGTAATVYGFAGVAGQAQKTGFGVPTGGGVIANFPGATATLAQCSQAIAQLILDLKALGFYGA